MLETPDTFAARVCALVSEIPVGRVMTYGQIAALCGSPRAARVVGGVAHYGPAELPWHRVINKSGGLARGFPGGRANQAGQLAEEGVDILPFYQVDVSNLLWWPQQKQDFE